MQRRMAPEIVSPKDKPLQPMTVYPLPSAREVAPGDDLGALLQESLQNQNVAPERGDIVVVAQKIVSKAEGRIVDLRTVTPSARARELAALTLKDPRMVEVVLSESVAVVRAVPHVLIVRHRNGCVMANAGIDHSNVPVQEGREPVLLLPAEPDAAAAALRRRLADSYGFAPGVVIADSFGRPWRLGVTHVAIGAAGIPALVDLRGQDDREGRVLEVSQVAFGDAVATAAGLVMGEAAEGCPAVLVRGLRPLAPELAARGLVRPESEDLFR